MCALAKGDKILKLTLFDEHLTNVILKKNWCDMVEFELKWFTFGWFYVEHKLGVNLNLNFSIQDKNYFITTTNHIDI